MQPDRDDVEEVRRAADALIRARRSAPSVTGPGRNDPAELGIRRRDLELWRGDALARIEQLVGQAPLARPPAGARLRRVPPRPLRVAVTAEEPELTRALLQATADSSVDIARLQAREHEWHAVRGNAQVAIQLTDLGERVGIRTARSPRAHGLAALGRFMIQGNSPGLRKELRGVITSGVDTPGLRTMLARFHMMANQRQEAWVLLDHPSVRRHRAAQGLLNLLS